ncbi:hypothetical protein [Cellulomonas xiejunii]|uniref:Uncharacterized protein n=1 Tax=Cellulomonas xiejunii TaxID=2968083 RepID=A0ABY5KNE4_9CELL|nr:hypothetical protein [Cellulomonas xiejunii]MCC2320703.1 hypothetical protein [Cellulomonas xiejunii]UUI70991.1 hypothetical protein NP048_14490 [Cellulomonas xiejunii]
MAEMMAGRRKHLKRRLREAGHAEDSAVWSTAMALLPGWTGTLAELVFAAVALS